MTVQQIQAFKREQELEADGGDPAVAEEVDLRAEDDAAIAAELEEEAKRRAEEDARKAEEEAREAEEAAAKAAAEEDEVDEAKPKPRARRSRGGRTRRRTAGPLEGTFDHGEEGYGLWLDPAVQDDPVYAEHWAGHRPVEITIEEDQIVIRRAGAEDEDDD